MKLDRLALLILLLVLFIFLAPAVAKDHSDGKSHNTLEASEHSEAVSDHAQDKGAHGHVNLGEMLPLYSCIPFAFMLLSIALLPLIAENFWHHLAPSFWQGFRILGSLPCYSLCLYLQRPCNL